MAKQRPFTSPLNFDNAEVILSLPTCDVWADPGHPNDVLVFWCHGDKMDDFAHFDGARRPSNPDWNDKEAWLMRENVSADDADTVLALVGMRIGVTFDD